MKRIYLSNIKKYAIVDDEDYDRLIKYKWYGSKNQGDRNTYARRYVKSTQKGLKNPYKTVHMHRSVLNVNFMKGEMVDHINRNGLDNRKQNLRVVNQRVNNLNMANSKKYPCVSLNRTKTSYRVITTIEDKFVFISGFKTAKDAYGFYTRLMQKLSLI